MFAPDAESVHRYTTGRATQRINDDGGYATGNLPTDWRGGEEYAEPYRPCASAPVPPELPTPPHIATLDEVVAYLRKKNNDFAQSLADYYEKHGRLSEKQERYARRFYRDYYERCESYAHSVRGRHDWTPQGTVVWSNNTHLGTWSKTNYYLCSHCGLWLQRSSYNNYSGD